MRNLDAIDRRLYVSAGLSNWHMPSARASQTCLVILGVAPQIAVALPDLAAADALRLLSGLS